MSKEELRKEIEKILGECMVEKTTHYPALVARLEDLFTERLVDFGKEIKKDEKTSESPKVIVTEDEYYGKIHQYLAKELKTTIYVIRCIRTFVGVGNTRAEIILWAKQKLKGYPKGRKGRKKEEYAQLVHFVEGCTPKMWKRANVFHKEFKRIK